MENVVIQTTRPCSRRSLKLIGLKQIEKERYIQRRSERHTEYFGWNVCLFFYFSRALSGSILILIIIAIKSSYVMEMILHWTLKINVKFWDEYEFWQTIKPRLISRHVHNCILQFHLLVFHDKIVFIKRFNLEVLHGM